MTAMTFMTFMSESPRMDMQSRWAVNAVRRETLSRVKPGQA